jgi:hypothetical protein
MSPPSLHTRDWPEIGIFAAPRTQVHSSSHIRSPFAGAKLDRDKLDGAIHGSAYPVRSRPLGDTGSITIRISHQSSEVRGHGRGPNISRFSGGSDSDVKEVQSNGDAGDDEAAVNYERETQYFWPTMLTSQLFGAKSRYPSSCDSQLHNWMACCVLLHIAPPSVMVLISVQNCTSFTFHKCPPTPTYFKRSKR